MSLWRVGQPQCGCPSVCTCDAAGGFRPRQGAVAVRQGALTTVFEGPGLQSIRTVRDVEIPPGHPFVIELVLAIPVARAFDLPLAERIFRPIMPPGLELQDVHSDGSSTVIIESLTRDVSTRHEMGQAEMGFLPAVAAVAGFLAVHWLGVSLSIIGISVALGFLVTTIRGKTLLGVLGIPSWGAVLLGLGALALLMVKSKRD